MMNRLAWALTGAMAVIAVLALARATVAGSLDPPGPVASTMRTLDELRPSWSRQIHSDTSCNSPRFTCVLPTAANPAGEAVLDHETGLVWERVAGTQNLTWQSAYDRCLELMKGGRQGWRLPQSYELASLLDADSAGPFQAGSIFWSATPSIDAGYNYAVDFSGTGATANYTPGTLLLSWCVRGSQ